MKPILACTDGSLYAPSIYEHAAWAARRDESLVRVLHVLEREETLPTDLTGSLGFDAGAELMEELVRHEESHARVARLRGKAILEDAAKQLRELGVSQVETLQRHGALVDTVDEFEGDAEVVVIGKRGEHANFSKGHLGSNLERVVRATEIPVLVAARAFNPITSFLLAFDGGDSALKAVHYAASNPLLKGLQAHLVAVGKPGGELERELEKAATALRGAGFEVQADLLEGDPDKMIIREAEDRQADLLVMGAYGHSRIRRFVIGSTTTALVRECHIPVLLFR
ncbi:universal stress protein [Roseibacillus ishigakijimensis]|uniref:Universal stress protein n=1 Tax=Roseibacillus ishigakijimensis TaxID=454146 RepID=A0A934VN39_9BACT|nr:universal stress protein [Roseibacillus ishigakijimensis]MBK1834620.1 universal stress protein [Roseibacillus ishigakijimensis]